MEIIIKPVLTEKMTIQGEKLNRYGFIVDREANKLEIKAAVEEIFGVEVEKVTTITAKVKANKLTMRSGPGTGYHQLGGRIVDHRIHLLWIQPMSLDPVWAQFNAPNP